MWNVSRNSKKSSLADDQHHMKRILYISNTNGSKKENVIFK